MKIEGSVQELEQFFKKFTLKEKRIIKIDVGKSRLKACNAVLYNSKYFL